MNSRDDFLMIIQQLSSLTEDLHVLADKIAGNNICRLDDTRVHNLADFSSVIADDLRKLLRKHNLV